MAFWRTWPGKLLLAAAFIFALLWLDYYLSVLLARKAMSPYYFRIAMLAGISVVLAVSLNLVNGVTGQFSIGHAGFMALGGYTGAALTVYGQHSFLAGLGEAGPQFRQTALVLALLAGGTAAAVAGFVVGLPSLRLRGDYLAIVTLGFGEIIRVAILNIEAVGGAAGFSSGEVQGRLVPIPQLTTFFWVYLSVAVVVVFSRNLLTSTPGLTYFSVREDEVAAEAMGVGTTRIKVTAFVISAFFAGVAGALFAHYDSYLKPDSFNFLRSIEIITMVVLGGTGSISGSVVGAVILVVAPEWLRVWLGEFTRRGVIPPSISADLVRQLLYALLLIVLMLTRPQGLFGGREISFRWLLRRKAEARR